MAEQENVRIVQEAYAAFGRGDIPAVLNVFADDMEYFVPGPTDIIPTAGQRRDPEQVAQLFATINETEEVQQFEPQEFIAQGDMVVVLGHSRARVKSTGRTLEGDWVDVITLRDGKAVRYRHYYDTAAAVEAFRATPSQAAKAT